MIVQDHILRKTLDAALSTGADFAEVFLENTYSSTLSLLSSQPQKAIVGELYGAGIRLFFDHEIIYVTTNDLSEEGLVRSALKAARSHTGTPNTAATVFAQQPFDQLHTYGEKPWESDRLKKFAWLKAMNEHARQRSTSVVQVEASLYEKFQKVQIVNSAGVNKYDERIYSRAVLEVTAEKNGVKESFSDRHGFLTSADFVEGMDLQKFSFAVTDRAVELTAAQFAPAGEMPVVIDSGFGGVIFHEACGHGLETTSVAKGASVFAGKLGQKVAADCVTAVDDGTIKNEWGSIHIDDEGRPTEKTTLIENGILKSYIVDEMGSRQTGYKPTGSGRRESYKYAPASRMRNTFIAPGNDTFADMIKDIDYGLYAKTMGGGSVNPGTGEYNFAAREAYVIRKGRIEELVKGATLIGKGIDTLGKITKVSNELKLSTGMCGSVSGSIPTTVGQPQILVSSLLVGGRGN